MRLVLKLKSEKDCVWDKEYYHKLRGFIYSLQRGLVLNMHNNVRYKYFCYSPILPQKDMKKGDIRTLIISSPITNLVKSLHDKLKNYELINIGEMSFRLIHKCCYSNGLKKGATLYTVSPIVIKIQPYLYEQYGIKSKRPFEYWKPTYDWAIFEKQLLDNCYKKYEHLSGKSINRIDLFEDWNCQKSVAFNRVEKGREIVTIGSLWSFSIKKDIDDEHLEMLQSCIDSGLGELNPNGLGFMQVVT